MPTPSGVSHSYYNTPVKSECSLSYTLGSRGSESKTVYNHRCIRGAAGICIQAVLLHVWHSYHQSISSVTCSKSHCYREWMELFLKLRVFKPSLLSMSKNKISYPVGIVGGNGGSGLNSGPLQLCDQGTFLSHTSSLFGMGVSNSFSIDSTRVF